MKVERRWTDRRGKTIDPAKIKIGDLILGGDETDRALGGQRRERGGTRAIVDALPAGLEVENPAAGDVRADRGRECKDRQGQPGGRRRRRIPPSKPIPATCRSANPLRTMGQTSKPDRVEFRDDRVVIFCSADSSVRTYRYALRAVTAGSFVWPAIQASCMYDAAFASVHGGGRVEVAR